MGDPCPICGVNRDMVGKSHRCVPKFHVKPQLTASSVQLTRAVNIKPPKAQPEEPMPNVHSVTVPLTTVPSKRRGKYPNTDERRAYMRNVMRKKRAKA